MDTEKPWRDAHRCLAALDANWEKPRFRKANLDALKTLLAQSSEPHLQQLVRLVTPEMTRKQLWDLLVPVERQLARTKITDIEILSTDKSPDAAPRDTFPFTVVADNFRSAINIGTLFRVSECFGAKQIVLTGYSPEPSEGRAKAAALGAEAWVPFRRFHRTAEALQSLKAEGIRCVALETVPTAPLVADYAWLFPCALFLGSERFGLDPDVVQACDDIVRIPVFGRKNSLNVVTAFAIAAHAARLAYEGQK